MLRTILGVIVGIAAWLVVVFALSYAIKAADPALAAAMKAHATLAALWERLAISFVASLISGAVAAAIARDGVRAPLITGLLLLAGFGYYHSTIWPQFPVWYHLTFFVSLVVLSLLGGRLAGSRR